MSMPRTEPFVISALPIELGATSRPLSEWSRTSRPVIEIAAYALPPSATKSAMVAVMFA
jgi:hypothetical protein